MLAIGDTQNLEIIVINPTKPVKTYDYQRIIRDDQRLSASHKLVLFVLTTYLPTVHPSVTAIAKGARLNIKTVSKALSALENLGYIKRIKRPGKPSSYQLTTPKSDPTTTPKRVPNPNEYPTQTSTQHHPQMDTQHHPQTSTHEEIKKRQRREQASEGAHIASKEAKAERLAGWQDVWNEVVGVGALPTLAQLRRVRLDVTEDMLSHCLGETALAVGTKDIGNARGLFFAELRKAKGDEAPWTKEQVKRALYPASLTRGRDMRRPSSQPAPKPPPPETEEEKQARRARTAAVLASLDRSILFGGDA